MFNDIDNVCITLFSLEVFARAYGLKTPKQFFLGNYFDKFLSKSKYEQVVKCWMEDPTLVIPVSLSAYPVSWFKEPFSLLTNMFCRLYGLPNCSLLKNKWLPMANHVFLTGDLFYWVQILFCNLWEQIEKYQKTLVNRKPSFYMSGFVMDAFCACSCFPELNWDWIEKCPPVHIYCIDM